MIEWINENNGFLMVIITSVYVVATIVICIFNGKSAKASREQIIAMQKQQEQNMGLQLYSMRSDVIHKIDQGKLSEVMWDISVLFGEEVYKEYMNIFEQSTTLNQLETKINLFETAIYSQLSMAYPDRVDTMKQINNCYAIMKNYEGMKMSLLNCLKDIPMPDNMNSTLIDQYIDVLKDADNARNVIETDKQPIIESLTGYIRKSIQQ